MERSTKIVLLFFVSCFKGIFVVASDCVSLRPFLFICSEIIFLQNNKE